MVEIDIEPTLTGLKRFESTVILFNPYRFHKKAKKKPKPET
jgi:hypothetical protein